MWVQGYSLEQQICHPNELMASQGTMLGGIVKLCLNSEEGGGVAWRSPGAWSGNGSRLLMSSPTSPWSPPSSSPASVDSSRVSCSASISSVWFILLTPKTFSGALQPGSAGEQGCEGQSSTYEAGTQWISASGSFSLEAHLTRLLRGSPMGWSPSCPEGPLAH